ncbi:MAG: glycosyltransferase family 4 protein, partial [Deltaproteobacteria bacterium]|nr:glycosyltransferase family 4 protein [Deltaproteobacteria bacterium]
MGQAKPPLEVLAFLVDLRRYQDRMLMLRHASEQLGRLHLVTPVLPPGFDPEPLRTPSFEIVPLAKRLLPRPVLQPLLHVLVLQRLALFPGIRILHDTMGFFIPLFAQERLLGRMGCPRPALLTSSFAALYDWHGVVRHRWPYRWHRFLRARWQGLALERAIFALADAVTLFGEGHREPLARAYGIPPERVFSLPNCVDEALFRPVAPEA